MPSVKSPRKRPSQSRSKDTVDAILQATEQIVSERASVTDWKMSDIAARAGVSVGTLYQYFAGQESLLAAWEERETSLRATRLVAKGEELRARAAPVEEVIREIVTFAFDAISARFGSYAEMGLDDFASRYLERLRLAEPNVAAVTALLASPEYAKQLRRTGPAVAQLVVRTVGSTASDSGFLHLVGDERDAIKRELVEMVTLYLMGEIPRGQ